MTDFKEIFPIALIVIAYLFCAFSPIWLPLAIAWRQRGAIKDSISFISAVAITSYGFFALLITFVFAPVAFFSLFLAPAMREAGYLEHSYLMIVADFFATYWQLALPYVLLLFAIPSTYYFARRWSTLSQALNQSP